MAITQYVTTIGAGAGQIGEVLQSEWLVRNFLDELVPGTTLYRYGTHPDMPLSTAKKARWLIFSRITPDASPAAGTEGTEPTAARNTDVTSFDATIAEFPDFIEVSSLLDLTAISGTTQKLARLMGQLAKEQIENVIHVELDNHALAAPGDISELSGGDVANGIFDTDELFKAESLKRIRKKLATGFARPHPMAETGRKMVLVASPRIFYEWLGDTQAQAGGTNISAVIAQAARRMSVGAAVDDREKNLGETGDVHPGMFGVEVVLDLSDRVVSRTVNAVATNTQNNYAFGDQAFGLVDLQSDLANPAIIRKIPGPTTVSQPTNAKQTIGYRIYFAAKLFNAATMVKFGSV